jgi:hypothetical protein
MFQLKLITIFFALKNLFIPDIGEKKHSGFKSGKREFKIERISILPDSVLESSGLEIAKDGQSFWTNGDGGNKNQLYEFDQMGNVLSVLPLPGTKNIDWEELAKDDLGNIYVCDIGNNRNQRRDLTIYKLNVNSEFKVDTIHFTYPDQYAFPPEKKEMNFDCEAVFWYNSKLYLISKNRGKRMVKIYTLPDVAGDYVAELIDSIFIKNQITAGDISPDHKSVVLMSYGKVYYFKTVEGNTLKLVPYKTTRFNRSGESEAVVFLTNNELLITNEQRQIFKMKKK